LRNPDEPKGERSLIALDKEVRDDRELAGQICRACVASMVTQERLSPVDAVARLRAHSFTVRRPLPDVAADVVAHRLRLLSDL
jgi:hypothetical protein